MLWEGWVLVSALPKHPSQWDFLVAPVEGPGSLLRYEPWSPTHLYLSKAIRMIHSIVHWALSSPSRTLDYVL